MTRILFVCHGNICRSPMAEFVLRDMCSRAGLAAQFDIASAATSSEELGNPVYPPARRKLAEHGIGCEGKTARRIRPEDYNNYDLLIGMDDANMRNMARAFGGDPEGKLHLLLEYAGRPGEAVADPWYTRDFEATWRDVNAGCLGLLNVLHPQVTLDLSACRERRELYSVLRRAMLWQDWYSENLDALHDILTGQPYLGRSFIIILPDIDSPCRAYAERIANEFAEAGLPVEVKN